MTGSTRSPTAVRRTAVLCAAALTLTPGRASAAPPTATDLVEFYLHAQSVDFMGVSALVGTPVPATLVFTQFLDPSALTFTWDLTPGQTYAGVPVSLHSAGGYNGALGQFAWTTTGFLGTDAVTATGTVIGDPDIDQTITVRRDSLHVVGTYTPLPDNTSTNSGTVTNNTTGVSGSFSGTDSYDAQRKAWRQTITYGKTTTSFNVKVDTRSSCNTPACSGFGTGFVSIAQVPEPATLALVGAGVLAAGALRRRPRV